MLNDQELLDQLKAGHERAYQQLFDKYYITLVALASKVIHDIDLARDCAQGVFIRLYEKRSALNITVSLAAYLKRAVLNEAINAQKKEPGVIPLSDSTIEVDDTHRHLMEEAEEEARIWHAIDDLPDKCRHIFKLNRFDGFSNQEIADKLDLSKRTVETQMSIALKKLRAKLLSFFELFF